MEDLRKLINKTKAALDKDDTAKAMEYYPKIREIYDSISPEMRKKLSKETIEIIILYNNMIRKSS